MNSGQLSEEYLEQDKYQSDLANNSREKIEFFDQQKHILNLRYQLASFLME